MTSRRLYVVNESTLVDKGEAIAMASACNAQVRDHAAPAWGVARVVVEYHAGTMAEVQAEAPRGSWVLRLVDTTDEEGALGWHWQDDQDRVYGEIAAKPCLDAGSTALSGTYAVSSVLSHEVLETLCDPFCGGWEDSGRGYMLAREVCDPVEADVYPLGGVAVSNFVLPDYFNSIVSAAEKYDYLGKLEQPFAMTPGGYWVQMPSGKESQQFKRTRSWMHEVGFDVRDSARDVQMVFSPQMPEWRREQKLRTGRNAIKRHLAGAVDRTE
jgi:hypothetical protein